MEILLIVILMFSLFGFSLQTFQCQQKYVQEADGKYNFVVDCSNLGLESFPAELSELATVLHLNGNRLKNIDKKSLEKLVYLEVLDLSANDITSLPVGIFSKNEKLKTFPKSLRGRDIRRLTEKDVIVDCASKRKLSNQSKDGHYAFHVAGSGGNNIKLLIYCHKMDSDTPKEYLTLPGGVQGNFVRSNGETAKICLKSNDSYGKIPLSVGFNKVRLHLQTLTIIPGDATFATAKHHALFGSGILCGINTSNNSCIGAHAMIDLRGTPFKVKDSVTWELATNTSDGRITRKFDGAVIEIKCASTCTGCSLSRNLLLETVDSDVMPYEACSRPLGVQDGRIPASNITASSYIDRNFLPSHAKLFNTERAGWCAAKQDTNQFLQVDLGSLFTISGISTQGYETYSDWVTSYKIVYMDDDDTWKEYTIFGSPKAFRANTDSRSVVTHWLDPRLRARVVRIRPLTWYNGDKLDHRICLRFELYGCKNDVSSYIIKLGDNKPCILAQNHTENSKLVFDSKCYGSNFMFRFGKQNSLVHTASGLCLGMTGNSTAILTSNCTDNAFDYKRIQQNAFKGFNLIVKHRRSGKCVRFKRDKATHHIKVSLRKCGDIFQILLILTRNGVTPLSPVFRETMESRRVDLWSNQLFHCILTSEPPAIFAWSKDVPMMKGGDELSGDNFHIFENRSLLIRNISWSDRGNYFCNALNSAGSNSKIVELNVNAMQKFIIRPESKETIVGQTAKFKCQVEGIPKPRILWRRKKYSSNGFIRVDSLDQRRFKLLPNGTLVILNVHFDDMGLYTCVAKSPGKLSNATVLLTVYVPPRITLSSTKKSLFVGDSARVACLATGEPYPAIAWYKSPVVNLTEESNRGLIDGNISFDDVTKKDAGMYVCMATNRAGLAIEKFQLDVIATCSFIHPQYSSINPSKSSFIENEQVGVKCNKGFQLLGAASLKCTSHGNWSHPFPRCTDIDECNRRPISEGSGMVANSDTEPDVCHVNALCTNTIGSYKCTCEEGYEGNGFACSWRTTTTKATTTTQMPTTKQRRTEEFTHEDTTATTEPPSTTTEVPYAPSILIVIFNYTQRYVNEHELLTSLLDHSHSIGELSSMNDKVTSLNITLNALRIILASTKDRLVDTDKSFENLKIFSSIVSSLLDSASIAVWKRRGEVGSGVSDLIQIVEGYCKKQLKHLATKNLIKEEEINANNIVLRLKNLQSSVDSHESSVEVMTKNQIRSKVIFRKDSLPKFPKPMAILVYYKNLDRLMKAGAIKNLQFVSKIASLTVAGIKDGSSLREPIRLIFRRQLANPRSPECVFWKFDKLRGGGDWSNEGCRLHQNKSAQQKKSTVTCECDHMTTFAVIQRQPISGKSEDSGFFVLSLSLVVIVGCGMSIFVAFLTCISHLCFSSYVRSDRRVIMINISACVLLGSTIFLGGALLSSFKLIKNDISKYFCLAFSGSLQLFFISFFCWMLAEAVQIYLSTRTVIDKGSGKLTVFYLLGWGFPAIVVGLSMILISFEKIKVNSWCWMDLSSYGHFLLTGIPVFTLFIVTVVLYAFISTSLRRNKDLLNPFVQKYTKFALWCSPVLLVLHVMTILAVSAFFSFNSNYICHYILGGLFAIEGIFLIVYQCYIEKTVLAKSVTVTSTRSKRSHSYSVKDTVTYGEETCIEDGNGKYLIRRPSKRCLQDSSRAIKESKRSDLNFDSDSNYFDMYGTSDRVVSTRLSGRVAVVDDDDIDEDEHLLKDDGTDDSNETYSEPRETQLTSFDTGNGLDIVARKKGPSTCGSVISVETVNASENFFKRKLPSNCGSVVSMESKSRQQIQGIPVYFPGSAPPQHVLTLERKKREAPGSHADSEEMYDKFEYAGEDDIISHHESKESTDPDRISNISNELTCILKELEAFSSDAATPSLPRKVGKPSNVNKDNSVSSGSPIWQKRRPPYERQENVEMTDVRSETGQQTGPDWYGEMKDSGDGLHTYTDNFFTSV